jgi:hypothetical protein
MFPFYYFYFSCSTKCECENRTRKQHNILNVPAARFVAFFFFFLLDGSGLSPKHVLHESLNSQPVLNESF